MFDYFELTTIELGLILIIAFLLFIAISLLELNSKQKETNRLFSSLAQFLVKNEILKGVSGAYLNGRQCLKCDNLFVPEIFSVKNKCPFCGLSYQKGNVIYKYNGKVKSSKKKIVDRLGKKVEIEVLVEL